MSAPKAILDPSGQFQTMIYTIMRPELVREVSEASEELLVRARAAVPLNEVYPVHMTESLIGNPKTLALEQFIAESAWAILDSQGYRMNDFLTYVSEFWVQEHHKHSGMDQHVHPHGVVLSGFFFLETPDQGCMVELHDPRPGKVMASLPLKNPNDVSGGNNSIFYKPEPGLLMFTNSWLPHSFTRNGSDKPVKFVHFNVSVKPAQNGPIII